MTSLRSCSWLATIAPTGIAFPRNSSLGPFYENAAMVGDANYGQLYAFPLNGTRTEFDVAGIPDLADLVADTDVQRNALRFGRNFGLVTDLEMGPDGHLYVVSLTLGSILRVQGPAAVPALPPWAALALVALLGAGTALYVRARS